MANTLHKIPASVMYPKPVQKPRPPILIGGYVDRVLKRAAIDGDGWLTYFYRRRQFREVVGQNPRLCKGRRQGSQ